MVLSQATLHDAASLLLLPCYCHKRVGSNAKERKSSCCDRENVPTTIASPRLAAVVCSKTRVCKSSAVGNAAKEASLNSPLRYPLASWCNMKVCKSWDAECDLAAESRRSCRDPAPQQRRLSEPRSSGWNFDSEGTRLSSVSPPPSCQLHRRCRLLASSMSSPKMLWT